MFLVQVNISCVSRSGEHIMCFSFRCSRLPARFSASSSLVSFVRYLSQVQDDRHSHEEGERVDGKCSGKIVTSDGKIISCV